MACKYAYNTKAGVQQWKPSFKWIESVCNEDSYEGFCLACGETQSGIEPDARKCVCEACGAPKVYGAEQLALMGLYH